MSVPNIVIDLKLTSIFECFVLNICRSKNKHQKDVCSKEIELQLDYVLKIFNVHIYHKIIKYMSLDKLSIGLI